MAEYLLGLDIGTSTAHCVLTDTRLRPLAVIRAPMTYYTPPGCSSLAREFDPGAFMDLVGGLVAEAAKQERVAPGEIAAVGITSQRQAVVFLDSEGNEVLCSHNLDMRAIFQGAAIDDEHGDEVYRLTGHFPSFMLAAARLRWLRETHHEAFRRLDCVLPLASWLAYRLTGKLASEPAIDAEAGTLDISSPNRCATRKEILGVDSSWLPTLHPAGTVVGEVTSEVTSWGLAAGTPVTIAGPDTQCALLAMGVVEPGQQAAVLGWSAAVQQVTAAPCLDLQKQTWAGYHPIDGLWVAEANLGDLGHAHGWLKDLLLGVDTPFEHAEAMAASVAPGADGVLALLGAGPNTAPRAGLTTGGLLMPVPLAFQEATAAQLLRAGLESVAFSIKANRITLERVAGQGAGFISVAGGMASSPTLLQILADVLGMPVQCSSHPEATGRGAAAAAAMAAGMYSSLGEAVAGRCDPTVTYSPCPATAAEYVSHYDRWLETAQRVQQVG